MEKLVPTFNSKGALRRNLCLQVLILHSSVHNNHYVPPLFMYCIQVVHLYPGKIPGYLGIKISDTRVGMDLRVA